MPLSVNTKLGPYEILAPIGEGGMGQVYRARDTRLDRIVAIKVAKEKFSQRFEREAHAIAALNHPNICTLYDVGPNYLAMEFVEGGAIAPTDNHADVSRLRDPDRRRHGGGAYARDRASRSEAREHPRQLATAG